MNIRPQRYITEIGDQISWGPEDKLCYPLDGFVNDIKSAPLEVIS